jgi:aminopeptidase-like protein
MTSMLDLINEIWFLKRDLVSDDFDRALYRLAREIAPDQSQPDSPSVSPKPSMLIHEVPTGTPVWTWKVPEKWTCHEAYLETLDGKRLIDVKDHPLHVVSYSLPFEGVVSREVLLQHLHVHPRLPEAIPYVFKYYDRDWGLCASQVLCDSLSEASYRVVIRTSFEPGMLKIGEVVIPGETDETFMLVAHLCHPAMVNDDLTGVVVGLEVVHDIVAEITAVLSGADLGYRADRQAAHQVNQKQADRAHARRPYYTYRLLILPETIGSVAYLSQHEDLIPRMVGGLFLEMLGNNSPHALQGSFQPDSQADRCLVAALRGLDPQGYSAPYRMVINNDERQFNAPGVRVPMLSLSRVLPRSSPDWPYPEYHSSLDTPAIVTQERLEASKRLVLGLLQAWEQNQYVVNNFKGEIFCSGYGIWIDYRLNPEGHRRLFEIMERCDGERTVADIATELGISFQAVWAVVKMLLDKGLVWLSRTPHPTHP